MNDSSGRLTTLSVLKKCIISARLCCSLLQTVSVNVDRFIISFIEHDCYVIWFVEHHGHFIKKLFMGKSDNMVFTRAFDLYIIKILCFILKE